LANTKLTSRTLFFYIKQVTQAGLPRRLRHPKKMIICDLAALDGPSQRLHHQKNGRWIAIERVWIHLGTALLHSIIVGHVAGFLCREAAWKLHAVSTLPDKDVGSGHTWFLGWAIADRVTELTPSSLLPSSMVTFCFPAPFSLS
jgi:hypothetical protein